MTRSALTCVHSRSTRQSSIGAASIGEGILDEDLLLVVPPRPSQPANSQQIADAQVANFFSYVNRVRAQLPDEQPLFFSDLAPIADSTVSEAVLPAGQQDLLTVSMLTFKNSPSSQPVHSTTH